MGSKVMGRYGNCTDAVHFPEESITEARYLPRRTRDVHDDIEDESTRGSVFSCFQPRHDEFFVLILLATFALSTCIFSVSSTAFMDGKRQHPARVLLLESFPGCLDGG